MYLITDRTKTDVLMGMEKGQYGIADLNRVEKAVAELANKAEAIGVKQYFVVKRDWEHPSEFSEDNWPTETQMRRYLDNVYRLCQVVELAAELPVSMKKLTWEGANQIEKALELVYTRIQSILQAIRYSGEIFAGEENGL